MILFISLLATFIISNNSEKNPSSEGRELFSYEQNVVIDKPAYTVWEYLDDMDNCKDYIFVVKSVSKIPEGPINIDTELIFHMGFLFKNYTNYYKVIEYKPPNLFSFQGIDGSAVKSTGSIVVHVIDSSSTKLTIKYNPEVSGFFTALSDKKVDKIYSVTISRILKKLKKNVE